MLTTDEVKYMEDEIKKMLSSISNEYYQLMMRSPHDDDEDGWTESWLTETVVTLYYHIVSYFEAKGMHKLLQSFQSRFDEQIINKKLLLDSELIHPDGDSELKIITHFKRFLSAFKTFDYREAKEEEFSKLVKVLQNSGFIIKNSGCTINGEADIYKQVKWVLSLYYPSCKSKSNASFIKQFKTYNPDILVPELKTAIEYKYLKSKSDNPDNFIDQILVDARGYTGDHYYENFVAVFYISDAGIATPESIELAWKAKGMPDNWRLVITGESIKPREIK